VVKVTKCRLRIYELLLQNKPQMKIADILHISKSTVSEHVARLKNDDVIKEDPIRFCGISNSKSYVKDIESDAYDKALVELEKNGVRTEQGDTMGDVSSSKETDIPNFSGQIDRSETTRVHNIQFKINIVSFPKEDKMEWGKPWEFNGTRARKTKLLIKNIGWVTAIEVRGKKKNTFKVCFPELFIPAENLGSKKEYIIGRAFDVGCILSKYFGYRLGLVECCSDLEFGFREPLLDKMIGAPVRDENGEWWIDNSPGKDKSEWETKNPNLAEIRGRMPSEIRDLKQRVGILEEKEVPLSEIKSAIIKVDEKIEKKSEQEISVLREIKTSLDRQHDDLTKMMGMQTYNPESSQKKKKEWEGYA